MKTQFTHSKRSRTSRHGPVRKATESIIQSLLHHHVLGIHCHTNSSNAQRFATFTVINQNNIQKNSSKSETWDLNQRQDEHHMNRNAAKTQLQFDNVEAMFLSSSLIITNHTKGALAKSFIMSARKRKPRFSNQRTCKISMSQTY